MTWAILVWTAIFTVWIGGGIGYRPSKDCATDPAVVSGTLSLDSCQAASDVGTGIGVVLIGFLWFIGFIVLSLVWFISRPRAAAAA
jgi:hypothetical protein